MSRNVLSGREVQFLSDGFPIDNKSWKGVMLRRALEDKELRRLKYQQSNPTDSSEVVMDSVMKELSSEDAITPPVDVRQTAAEEAEMLLVRAREEAETIAVNIREDAKVRSAMMVEKAQAEAKEILEKAKVDAIAEIERVKRNAAEEGRQEGIHQGLSEGREKGQSEGKAEFAELLKNWNKILIQTIEERKRTLTEAQPLLVELVGEALYRCLKDESTRRSNMVLKFVEEALRSAHDRVHLRVHLNPQDLTTVEAKKKELLVSVGVSQMELVSDGRIEKGGCLLETEAGSIDVRLSTIVSQVKSTLTGS